MDDSLRFFIDRGLGSRVIADGLRIAGWSVTTMDERYGPDRSQRVRDVDWIGDASQRGEVLIAKDRAMAKRPLEAEAIFYNDARVFVLASAQVTGSQMLQRLIDNSSRIERLGSVQGPFVFGVYEDRVERIRLNYP